MKLPRTVGKIASVIIGVLVFIYVVGFAPKTVEWKKFCGEVTYQNTASTQSGVPRYWVEVTNPDTRETKEFNVTGTTMVANQLGDNVCFNERIFHSNRWFIKMGVAGVALIFILFGFGAFRIFSKDT